VSALPVWVVPEIVGGAVLAGGEGSCAATTGLGAETAVAEPPEFVAVTATRSVEPTSALETA